MNGWEDGLEGQNNMPTRPKQSCWRRVRHGHVTRLPSDSHSLTSRVSLAFSSTSGANPRSRKVRAGEFGEVALLLLVAVRGMKMCREQALRERGDSLPRWAILSFRRYHLTYFQAIDKTESLHPIPPCSLFWTSTTTLLQPCSASATHVHFVPPP